MAADTQLLQPWQFEQSSLNPLVDPPPCLPPKPWESLPSESGTFTSPPPLHSLPSPSPDLPSVSEPSLVRLVKNALQGSDSAVSTINNLSSLFTSKPADRSPNNIPSIWSHSLSTCALGNVLESFKYTGYLVIVLRKFISYFIDENELPPSLVNQAYAVAVNKVLEGYFSSLNTLNAALQLRRHGSDNDSNSVGNEVTLLELYLHTKQLRTQIEGLAYLCQLHDDDAAAVVVGVSEVEVEKFRSFPRGGDLVTYLYEQLQIVDPAHCTLIKYLFLRSMEPYCEFIRSWIYEAKIDDPYNEFIVEFGVDLVPKVGIPLATLREEEGVAVPCFLKDVLVPLLRAGQQLQVVLRLLRLCDYVRGGEYTLEDVLPGCSGFTSEKVSCSPLSFNKGEIEVTAVSRRDFYRKMHEKLESVLNTLDIKYRQVALCDTASLCAGYEGTLDVQLSSMDETEVLPSARDLEDSNCSMPKMGSEDSSFEDWSATSDLDSYGSSSTDDSEEEEADSVNIPHEHSVSSKLSCLSALCFSTSSSGNDRVRSPQTVRETAAANVLIGSLTQDSNIRKSDTSCIEQSQLSTSWISDVEYAGHVPNLGWPLGALPGNPFSINQTCKDIDRGLGMSNSGYLGGNSLCSQDLSELGGALVRSDSEHCELPATNSFLVQSWNAKYPCNVLSMNPLFSKKAFLDDVNKSEMRTSKISQRFKCFDFSSAANPFEVYQEKSHVIERHRTEPEVPCYSGTSGMPAVDGCGSPDYTAPDGLVDKNLMKRGSASLNSKSEGRESHMEKACGGSSWQNVLLGSLSSAFNISRNNEQKLSSEAVFQVPLDFVIYKCLLQEIRLQYTYISRLSIKLLEGGFDLQEHFLALRRYHFMEIADWADLFVTSLWNHKWYFAEPEQRIPEIQGLLESSIQRSSCEKDRNKDHLYVYFRDEDKSSFSAMAVGVHSFDFIGLGYRVDWPVTIVVTPSALRVYAQIFSFLIQVKLAVMSLSDVWCSLKEFWRLSRPSNEEQQLGRSKCHYLVKLRHQVNHFVMALQQYVLSQLSHVSWCRFQHSLKHEVKDMMDLESVHMSYLMDSMKICFLMEETKSISGNINSILQCALDLRSCIVKGIGDVGSQSSDSVGSISQINFPQVLLVKEKFDKDLKALHLSYLKSPKHAEFGLPRFWSYLNYNDFYSKAFDNEIWH